MEKKRVLREFVEKGVHFECIPGCTKCCAIPGMVFVKLEEIPRMAKFFKLGREEFMEKYLERHWGDVFNLNFPDVEPCMFLREEGCSIYEVRPAQCRTFPFWPDNITNAGAWKSVRKLCPGVGKGKKYLVDEMLEIADEVCFGPFL